MSDATYDVNAYKILQSLSPQGSQSIVKAIATRLVPPLPCVIQGSCISHADEFAWLVKSLEGLKKFPQIPKFIEGFSSNNRYYLVQTFIQGKSLDKILNEAVILPREEVIEFLKDILLTLELLHKFQLIHGDLKPKNLLYTNQWVLVDFSSTYLADRTIPRLGDAQYTAPEQLQGQGTYSSDLYSLGIICWQLLTGLSPFNILSDLTVSLEPPALNSILKKIISGNLSERFQSAREVLESLEKAKLIKRQKTLIEQLEPNLYTPLLQLEVPAAISSSINSVSFSPDGSLLASGGDDKVLRIWDVNKATEIGNLTGLNHSIKSLIFTPAGNYLIVGNSKGFVEVWDLRSKTIHNTFSAHSQGINALSFDEQSRLYTASADKTVKRWNLETGENLGTYKGHILAVTSLASRGNLLASGSLDRTIKIWDLDRAEVQHTLQKHTWAVKAIALSKDGKILASGGDDNQIIIWELASQQVLRVISGHSWTITALCFSQNDENLLSASWDKTIKIWCVATGELLGIFSGHSDCICTFALHPNEPIIASGGKDRKINLWRF